MHEIVAEDDAMIPNDMSMEEKIDKLLAQFASLAMRFDRFETRFDTLETRIDRLETRIDRLETRFDRLETRFDTLETKFDALETRVTSLESKMKIEFEDTRSVINLGFEKMDGFEQNVNDRFADVFTRIEDVKAVHVPAIVHLRTRIETLERERT